ncbi:hypothetical protein [Nocardiopsis sp. CNR-923]|uniref:hypothetical protein n=1 Tax=Nocardiopsis sp. CNR-923 TaxID=1904965 RepID=UPI00165140E1|nr:hypothetical protein [Nocardiopsis sp. CNR-923]
MALRMFATSITVFTVLGHLLLGFEQSPLTPIAVVLVAYAVDLALESLGARARDAPRVTRAARARWSPTCCPRTSPGWRAPCCCGATPRCGPTCSRSPWRW